ncbi:MAG: hypothetical protein LW828_05860 [Xanthomonadaceae bacterium]|jgi:predicted Zn-dependent protease|nr:hypothetical protein [Xanthomonadaceae bacterium]
MRDTVLAALAARNPSAALDAAGQWVEAEPRLADAHWALAQARSAAGDGEGALAALDTAIALAPDRGDLIAARAWLDLGARRLDAAKAGFDAALAQDPNQLGAYIPAAHLALARGDLEEAERLVGYARRVDDGHPHVLLLEGLVADTRGDEARALPLFNAAVQRAPEDALVLSTYALALLRRGHEAFAEQALRKAVGLGATAGLRGLLVGLLARQGRAPEAHAEGRDWAATEPASLPAQWALAQAAAGVGAVDEALAAIAVLRAAQPRHLPFFAFELRLRHAVDPAAAIDWLDAECDRDPTWTELWRSRIDATPDGGLDAVVDRWRAAAPAEPIAMEFAAQLAERAGRHAEADALAAQALALEPALPEAPLLRARHAVQHVPAEALTRIVGLLTAAVNEPQRRGLEAWRAVALDAAGRYEEAIGSWRRAWSEGAPLGVPAPRPAAASEARPGSEGGQGWLVWGPPGSRVERLNGVLAYALPQRLLIDRWRQPWRDDGFNLMRVAPDHPDAGSAERWRDALLRHGFPVGEAIDALPHWDGWTHATLHGTRLLVALRDPRDLLLNWMAWGSSVGLAFPGPGPAAAWLRTVLEQLIEAESAEPDRIVRIDADLFDHDPATLAVRLGESLGLSDAPDLSVVEPLGRGRHGGRADFAPGAWRRYAAGELAPVFAHLEPVAVRLGYPAR